MRINARGQVTIPAEIREQAGLPPHTEVDFEFDGTFVRSVPSVVQRKAGLGARMVAHLGGRGDVAMTTDAIMVRMRGD
jgi:AbrB family looped-hinge helix DNA binding protein